MRSEKKATHVHIILILRSLCSVSIAAIGSDLLVVFGVCMISNGKGKRRRQRRQAGRQADSIGATSVQQSQLFNTLCEPHIIIIHPIASMLDTRTSYIKLLVRLATYKCL